MVGGGKRKREMNNLLHIVRVLEGGRKSRRNFGEKERLLIKRGKKVREGKGGRKKKMLLASSPERRRRKPAFRTSAAKRPEELGAGGKKEGRRNA